MSHEIVKSADGTPIAYEVTGSGPALVLVGGAFCDRRARASGTPLAALLAAHFTVYSYDRRARGDSGDTPPYDIRREVEDLAALVDRAGADFAYGISSGALLVLEAAESGVPFTKIALYEPPMRLDASHAGAMEDIARSLDAAVAAGRRGEAAEIFLTRVVQVPPPAVEHMKKAPFWPGLERLAHTLAFDARIGARASAVLAQARSVRAPALVLCGEASPPWMREGLAALAQAIPGARLDVLAGQTHDVDPAVLAGALRGFLTPR